MTQLVVAHGGDDEASDARRDVLLAVHDEARHVGEFGTRLRGTIALSLGAKEVVRTDEWYGLKEIGERCETGAPAAADPTRSDFS